MRMIEPLERRALLSVSVPSADVPAAHSGALPQAQHHSARHNAGPSKTAVTRMEIRYMTNMIDHHHMAIMMGEMAVEKAVHPELKQLGEDIVETQMAEIEQMQTWLKDWYGIEHEPRMTRGQQKQMDKLEAMSGSEFEIAFLKEMIPHHRMAVMMSIPVAGRATHVELRELAQDVITTQTAEIQQMQTWLKDWYGIKAGGLGGGGMHAKHG